MLANLLYFLLSFERATEVMCFSSQLLRHYTQTNERMLVRIWMSLPGTMSDTCSAIHTRVPKSTQSRAIISLPHTLYIVKLRKVRNCTILMRKFPTCNNPEMV